MFSVKSFSKINSLDEVEDYSIVIETPVLDKNLTNLINSLSNRCLCTKFYVMISNEKIIKVFKKYNGKLYYYNGILNLSSDNIYNFIHTNCLCCLDTKK